MILNWLISAAAILLTAYILPKNRVTITFGSALIASIVIGLLNALVKPLLLILTLPINILTLGLFTLVINGIVITLASAITPGFKVKGFGMAIIFSIILTVVNVVIGMIFGM
jgi:putative membrane protein